MSKGFRFSPAAWYVPENRNRALTLALVLVAAISLLDFWSPKQLGLGNLYFLVILISAGFLLPWQVVLMCLVFTVLRESFNAIPKTWPGVIPRVGNSLVGYIGTGLFVREVVANRQRVVESLARVQEEVQLRQDAEEQLRVLVETSPAAIMILDGEGTVLDSNQAADRLFSHDAGGMTGESIRELLPVLGAVPMSDRTRQPFCTKIETRGRRRGGEVFPAHIWLSTYQTHAGGRLAAIVLDASEDLRDREEEGLHRLLSQSHIVAGAVWHEVRNLCAAISVVHANLRREAVSESPDFQALGSLVDGLKNLASSELRPSADTISEEVEVREVLEDLRIVVGGQYAEADAELRIEVSDDLATVIAERYGLLQVFLNLAQNSLRAMRNTSERVLTVKAAMEQDRVVVRFSDTGQGVGDATHLFQPFQRGAQVTGLGLYISRAIVRDFLGELMHEPQERGCCFAVILNPVKVAVEVQV
jgi:PAS domain S-box-containing protein